MAEGSEAAHQKEKYIRQGAQCTEIGARHKRKGLMDDRCIMPALKAKRRGIGQHWKGKESRLDILCLLRG